METACGLLLAALLQTGTVMCRPEVGGEEVNHPISKAVSVVQSSEKLDMC